MPLFQKNIVRKYASALNPEVVHEAYTRFKAYFLDPTIQQNILSSKEEQFQEGFLRELFVKVLGYTINPDPDYNLITEQKNETNAQKADGAILRNNEVIGIIELKDHKTTNLSNIESQAFGYKHQHAKARYVVVSNFEKLRFYIDNSTEYHEWHLFSLMEAEFTDLYTVLACNQLMTDIPAKIKEESVSSEEQITNALYKDYSTFKRLLFADLQQNNPAVEPLVLFKKSQKLLDRLLFIFFAEDSGLLPPNSMIEIINQWEQLKQLDEYQPLYNRVKKYFGYLDTGHQGTKYEIYAYNGGLFKPDEVLDSLIISDDVLSLHTRKLSEYDYVSDVDVNILGHIFENSLSEIDEITQQLESGQAPVVSKRKKDGVFYTPQYITKYIVENTVGRLCQEKKQELQIVEAEYFADKNRQTATKKRLLDKLDVYRDWLLNITICDPACGSGAFLNAALRFLMDEHKLLDEMTAKVTGSSIVFQNVENSILENNLYGVDINEESVEIAKLALWLRTAKPHRKLSSLNNNIKCGNSLISDPSVAGDKAFDWEKEFPQVFAKGGFDVVIGNPPYGAELNKGQIEDLITRYTDWGISKSLNDSYFVFYAVALQDLLKEKGLLGFISPNTWKLIESGTTFRHKLLQNNYCLYQVIQHLVPVFEDATVDCDTLFIGKNINETNTFIRFAKKQEFIKEHVLPQSILAQQEFINLFLTETDYCLKQHILLESVLLKDALVIKNGVKPYEKGKGSPAQTAETLKIKPFTSSYKVDDTFSPLIGGSYFNRYRLIWNNDYWIKYGEWLAAPREKATFEAEEKLIFRQTSDSIIGTLIGRDFIMRNNTHIVLNKENSSYNLKYILCCLNSALINYFYWTINPEKGEAMAEVKAFHLGLLPIKNISLSDQAPFIALADQMLSLNKDLQEKRARFLRRVTENLGVTVTTALETFDTLSFKDFCKELNKQKCKLSLVQQDEWEEYFNQYATDCHTLTQTIQATDSQIDELVYDLYGLTEEEKEIIKKS